MTPLRRLLVLFVAFMAMSGCTSETKDAHGTSDGTAGVPIEVTSRQMFDEAVKNNHVVLVDFSAAWCAPCQMMKPIVRQLAEKYREKVAVLEVDVDRVPGIADEYGTGTIPLFVIFRDGNPIDKREGAVPAQMLEEILKVALRS